MESFSEMRDQFSQFLQEALQGFLNRPLRPDLLLQIKEVLKRKLSEKSFALNEMTPPYAVDVRAENSTVCITPKNIITALRMMGDQTPYWMVQQEIKVLGMGEEYETEDGVLEVNCSIEGRWYCNFYPREGYLNQ